MRYSMYGLGVTAPTAGPAAAEHDEDDDSSVRSGRHQLTLINELPASGLDLADTLDRIEQRYLELALQRAGGVQTRAAELLGMSFRQFRYKLQKHRGEPCSKRHASAPPLPPKPESD